MNSLGWKKYAHFTKKSNWEKIHKNTKYLAVKGWIIMQCTFYHHCQGSIEFNWVRCGQYSAHCRLYFSVPTGSRIGAEILKPWTKTLTDDSAICCRQKKMQKKLTLLHFRERKRVHWANMQTMTLVYCTTLHCTRCNVNGLLFIDFLLANQNLTQAKAVCCHAIKSTLPC